jgi:hypothetical protein
MSILSFADSQPTKSKAFVLGAVALLALVIAVYFALAGPGTNAAVAADQAYICLNDQNTFTLTTAQIIEAEKAARAAQGEEGMRGPPPKLKCPKCGQFAAVIALKCPKDGSFVPLQDKTGQPGKCPKCGAGVTEIAAAKP